MPSNLEILTQINLDDLVASFGWQGRAWLARPLRKLFLRPAQQLAAQVVEFDEALPTRGLPEAARQMLTHYVRSLRVFGADRVADGPFLALCNHPGMTDTLAAFAALNRPNLKIIAREAPFLQALPNTSQQLFFLKEDSGSRVALVRQVASHLRAGGAVLTFPAGRIEPDPDVYRGATESLATWTDSVGVFLRMAPETPILPMLVRGVLWDKFAHHWSLGIRKTKEERERLGAALQLLAHVGFGRTDVHVRVQIGKPIYARELGSNDTKILHTAVLAEMKRLIESPLEGGDVIRIT